MAVPSYTTDLTTIATGDLNVDAGTWDESTNAGWDTGGAMVDDQNLYYNNTECVSAQMTKASNGSGTTGPATIMYNHTGTFTIPADGAALIHHLWAAPPALNTIGNVTSAGINVLAGNSLGDFYAWAASGSDFAPAPRGGWANYAINPAIGSPDHTVGTAPANYSMIGIGVSATAQARGNPNACNAIRYGRCEAIFTGGEVADYATFAGYGAIDDSSTNKWNLIEPVGTSGFVVQGLMSLGTSGTSVDFRDANKNLNIKDTINVTASFNRIEVNNAGSNVEWTAISFAALGTNSNGSFEAIDNATIAKTSCTFTDMGAFTYQSNSTLTNTTYRRCGLITQGSATITGCTIDNPTGTIALSSNNLASVSSNIFNSDGTGYAVDVGTISANTAVTWANETTGYVTGTAGTGVGVTPTGNETIICSVDSGFVLTVNVSTGATVPSVANSGLGTVDVVSSVTLTMTGLIDTTRVIIVNSLTRVLLSDQVATATGILTYSHSGGEEVDIMPSHNDYKIDSASIYDLTLDSGDQSIKFNQSTDLFYSNL